MAQYRLSADIIRRSKGRSVVAAAAYRAGDRLLDERTGSIKDYTYRADVLYSEILTPKNAPAWMQDRHDLWNEIERREDRSTRRGQAQLARDIELSLPHELTHEQHVELVREFVQAYFVDEGMVADIAIHAPPRRGDGRNHHAHILLSMRDIEEDGFGKKNRDWNHEDQLQEWRERWDELQNRALEKYGFEDRVDHRSLADQGIDREPTMHLGPATQAIEDKGIATDRGDENRRRKGVNDNQELLKVELEDINRQIAALERQLPRIDRLQKIVAAVESGYQRVEQRVASEQRGSEMETRPPQPYAGGPEASPMPDSGSPVDKGGAASEAKEQERQDQAQKAQEAQQEQARVAEAKRLDQLGQQYRDKVLADAQAMQQQQDRLKADRDAQQRHALWLEAQEKTAREARQAEQRTKEQQDKAPEGYVRNAGTRYAESLRDYDVRNPYASLAKAAMAEHAAFRTEQESLSRQIAGATDPKERQALELRKKIEGYDYLIITGDRIAGQSLVITGRADNQDRLRTLENVAKYRDEAKALREQYRDLQAERTAPEQAPEKAPEKSPVPTREGRPSERQPSKYARMVQDINDPEAAKKRKEQEELERQKGKGLGKDERER
jgi:hypothetical protein